MSERLSESSRIETSTDPEVSELLEFLDLYNEAQRLLGRIVEAGPGVDPFTVGVWRGKLQRVMQQLGLDPDDPDSFNKLEMIKVELDNRALHPQPRLDVPEVGFFSARIKDIIAEYEQLGAPDAPDWAQDTVATLGDVANYSYTQWREVESRKGAGHDVAEYIHGVARVMTDPLAYRVIFKDIPHHSIDRPTITTDWAVMNGRHRSLAARSLGQSFIDEARMNTWIKVDVKQP